MKFPSPVFPMRRSEVEEGMDLCDAEHPDCAGHGLWDSGAREVRVNKWMSPSDVLANVVHEYIHFAFPRRTEKEVDSLTGRIMKELTGISTQGSPKL